MIVRIMGEGQVEISADDIAVLNELDSELESAIEVGNEEAFRVKLHALLDKVRHVGKALPDDSLEPSELILPPADASIDEVREMLGDQGLIPG
ncbi:PspA-associated protein PspAA [Nonomuraea sp. 10N515B]|uniref:PspA-associated protein PspAA n=1 Tax=Nonomuraea sp. 10N515B TaxID=3457422 RepID=UPI003FCC9D49